jgi:hypothetical protein
MEPEKNRSHETPKGDENSLPIAESTPKQPPIEPVNAVEPLPIQNKFSAQPAQQQAAEEEHKTPEPLVARVIEDDEPSEFERKTLGYGGLAILVAFLALVAACVTAYFIDGQFKETAKQTKILSDSLEKEKQDSAAAAITTAQQLSIAQKQARAAQNSVLALERQMELDERPWIRIELGEKDAEKKFSFLERIGDPLTIPIRLINAGKTPAKRIMAIVQLQIAPKTEEPSLPKGHLIKLMSSLNDVNKAAAALKGWNVLPGTTVIAGRIFAGDHMIQRATRAAVIGGKVVPTALTVEEATSLANKNAYVMMSGEAHYFDGFSVEHWTRFCNDFFIDGETAPNRNCAKYADDDNNWSGKTTKPPN